jgi:acetyl esterase/lipase
VGSHFDVHAMRNWFKHDAWKIDSKPRCASSKMPVAVKVSNVQVTYGDERKDVFEMRVYDPQDGSESASSGVLRPGLIMIHGGGWVSGTPAADDRE